MVVVQKEGEPNSDRDPRTEVKETLIKFDQVGAYLTYPEYKVAFYDPNGQSAISNVSAELSRLAASLYDNPERFNNPNLLDPAKRLVREATFEYIEDVKNRTNTIIEPNVILETVMMDLNQLSEEPREVAQINLLQSFIAAVFSVYPRVLASLPGAQRAA